MPSQKRVKTNLRKTLSRALATMCIPFAEGRYAVLPDELVYRVSFRCSLASVRPGKLKNQTGNEFLT